MNLKYITETILNYKAGTMTAGSTFLNWVAAKWLLVNATLPTLAALAGLILTLTMIVSHICNIVRENRKAREESRQKELEFEEQKLLNEILKIDLKNKQNKSE